MPMTKLPAHDEAAERLDDMAGGGRALVAVAENEARRGEIERQPAAWSRFNSTVGKRRIRAAPGLNSDVIRISTENVIEMASESRATAPAAAG